MIDAKIIFYKNKNFKKMSGQQLFQKFAMQKNTKILLYRNKTFQGVFGQ